MNRTTQTIDAIENLIRSRRLSAGTRLPVEQQLAAELSVSRNTLREAIRALCHVGILETRVGDGTYVAAMTPGSVLGGLRFYSDHAKDEELDAVLEARRVLEPQVAALAAERRTDDDLTHLGERLEEMRAEQSLRQIVEADHRFHQAVATAARSPLLADLLLAVSQPTLRLRLWRAGDDPAHQDQAVAEHEAILEAIRNRQPDLAAASALVHIAGVEEWARRARSSIT